MTTRSHLAMFSHPVKCAQLPLHSTPRVCMVDQCYNEAVRQELKFLGDQRQKPHEGERLIRINKHKVLIDMGLVCSIFSSHDHISGCKHDRRACHDV